MLCRWSRIMMHYLAHNLQFVFVYRRSRSVWIAWRLLLSRRTTAPPFNNFFLIKMSRYKNIAILLLKAIFLICWNLLLLSYLHLFMSSILCVIFVTTFQRSVTQSRNLIIKLKTVLFLLLLLSPWICISKKRLVDDLHLMLP